MNLGMWLAEQSRFAEAEAAFRAALRREPASAAAAYNLSVLLANDRAEEAIRWARTAYQSAATAKNGYNLAFLLGRNGKADEAIATLRALVAREPAFVNGYLLLGNLLEGRGRAGEASRCTAPRCGSAASTRPCGGNWKARLNRFDLPRAAPTGHNSKARSIAPGMGSLPHTTEGPTGRDPGTPGWGVARLVTP